MPERKKEMKSTDKFYEIDRDAAFNAQRCVVEALAGSNEKHHLTMEDVNALGRILAYRLESGDDGGQYEHVVDFLWMSSRIEINHKMLLLDLLGDTPCRSV